MSRKTDNSTAEQLVKRTRELSEAIDRLQFSAPVHVVYNPLQYAAAAHDQFTRKYAGSPKKILFLGMNPGPFGMMQTGIPFGEIDAVRNWLGIDAPISKPSVEHPKRPVLGWKCTRSEVSGRRLWGLFQEIFSTPEAFFGEHYVMNYCPLGFLGETGSNITPDKIRKAEMKPVYDLCDGFLRSACEILKVEAAVGVGGFAEKRLQETLAGTGLPVYRILHPSPASPAANKDWAGEATRQMREQKLWN